MCITNKTRAGFTLIELLVVVSIIGILSSFAVVSLNSARSKARDALRKGDMAQLRTALNLYYDDNLQYPICGTWNAGAADLGASADASGANCYTNNVGNALSGGARPYLGKLPKDPKNGNNDPGVSSTFLYRYVSKANGSEYAVVYRTEDDAGNDQIIRGW